jgi:hypothetical protein
MRIIGCDLNARQQTVAMLQSTTGEVVKMTLKHEGNTVRDVSESGGYYGCIREIRVIVLGEANDAFGNNAA